MEYDKRLRIPGMIRGRTFSSSRVLYKVRVHFEIGLDDKVHDKSTLKKYKVQYKSTYKIIYSTISFIPSITSILSFKIPCGHGLPLPRRKIVL